MTKYYIPLTFKTGRIKNDSTTRAVTCKNTKKGWVNNGYFTRVTGYTPIDNPRDAEINVRRTVENAVQTFDNVATSGFKFSDILSWRDLLCNIIDPRGWKFYTTIHNFIKLIDSCTIINGVIQDQLVYAVDIKENRMRILKVGSPDYEEAIKEQQIVEVEEKIKSSISKVDLVIGKVYRIFKSADLTNSEYVRAVYLGKYKYSTEIKRIQNMVNNYNTTGCYHNYHDKGEKQRQQIIASLDRAKFVFLVLKDEILKGTLSYSNGSYQVTNNHDWFSYPGISPYLKTWDEKFDFSFTGLCKHPDHISVRVFSSFNPMIIRSLDKDQRLIIKDDWKKETHSRYYGIEHTNRYDILTYDRLNPVPDFNYREYKLETIQKAVSEMFKQSFDLIQNPGNYKSK